MDKQKQAKLTQMVQGTAGVLWAEYCGIFTTLRVYPCPKIILNNRFTKTAGCCYQDQNIIHIATKFLEKYPHNILTEILPHELAHQIDFNLYGLSEKRCGHGIHWQRIMITIGLEPSKYHSLVL